jgi:hypothetical protein
VQSFVRPSPRAQSLSNSSDKIFGLNSVERNIIGTTHGQTMEVPGGRWMNIDLHNFERLIGIEIRKRPGIPRAICRYVALAFLWPPSASA